jgi:signal transduction histidine kinase
MNPPTFDFPDDGPNVKQLSTFLGDLGHEVATPLASILLTGEMLADNAKGNLTDRQVRSLHNLIQAANEVQLLMKRVVTFTRLATRQLEFEKDVFPLDALVEEISTGHLEVKVEVLRPLPGTFESDRLRLFELLELLLEFAARLDPEPVLRVAAWPAGSLSFTVQATGSLSDEQLARALDPFGGGLKAARHGGGSGLELAIATRLASALGGQLEIAERPEGRLVFTASFPLPG